jgi:hypothetical protein
MAQKMATVTYEGPARILQLEEGGKEYKPGDEIRLSQAQLEDLVRRRHAFKDVTFDPDADLPEPHQVPDVQPEGAATKPSRARANANG